MNSNNSPKEEKYCNEVRFILMELFSVITCPECGHREREEMATDSCQMFYDCKNCGKVIQAKEGDCCVFCSYGSVPCPPIQEGKNCCG
jgi:transposase-like protein